MERDGIGDPGSNRGTEIPEQRRPRGADLVAILGVLRIGLQPQCLVVTTSRTLGLSRTQSPNRGSLKKVA